MTQITLPLSSRSQTDDNTFQDVYNNDAAITNVVNGNLENDNIKSGAAIAYAKLAAASTGQALIGNAGTPTMTTLAGAVTVGATGATSIAYYEDTQSADVNGATTGAITGISITPAAGTYFAFGTAQFVNGGPSAANRTMAIRVNAVAAIAGFSVSVNTSGDTLPLVVQGIITSPGSQAVDLSITAAAGNAADAVRTGRLVLIRLA